MARMPRKDNQYMDVLFACTSANLKHEDRVNTGVSLGVKRVLDKQYPFPAVRGRTLCRRHKLADRRSSCSLFYPVDDYLWLPSLGCRGRPTAPYFCIVKSRQNLAAHCQSLYRATRLGVHASKKLNFKGLSMSIFVAESKRWFPLPVTNAEASRRG